MGFLARLAQVGAREVLTLFTVDEVDTTWTIGSAAAGKGKKMTELLVRNF